MTRQNESKVPAQPAPLRISRRFSASREAVFNAWGSADHVKRWFSPKAYAVSDANVEMRVGGPFEVCMRGPDGVDHWSRGIFAEVSPFDRLVLDIHAVDADGNPLFRAYTEVSFTDVEGGTRIDILQTYTFLNPALAAPMVEGAPVGWDETLDKLAEEVARMHGDAPVPRSVTHATLRLERIYDAPVARVFEALSDEAAKSKWFRGIEGRWELLERHMDFRVGGHEKLKGKWDSGAVSTFEAIYHDIIPDQRIVYTYEMHIDAKKISVSLATMELKYLAAHSTSLIVTEQGAFLDGHDDGGSRERGTSFLLDQLGASLSR